MPLFSKFWKRESTALATLLFLNPPHAVGCTHEAIHALVEARLAQLEAITRQMQHWIEIGRISWAAMAPSSGRSFASGFCKWTCLTDCQTLGSSPGDIHLSNKVSRISQALSGSSLTSVPLNPSGPAADPRCFLAWAYISWALNFFQGKACARGVCKHQLWKASFGDGAFRCQIVCQKARIAFKASWLDLLAPPPS